VLDEPWIPGCITSLCLGHISVLVFTYHPAFCDSVTSVGFWIPYDVIPLMILPAFLFSSVAGSKVGGSHDALYFTWLLDEHGSHHRLYCLSCLWVTVSSSYGLIL
jgi:hypothetical protein